MTSEESLSAETIDVARLAPWIGRRTTTRDVVTERLVRSLAATLDRPMPDASCAAAVPASVHWCLAPTVVPTGELGEDGHPTRGGFLPPVPLPRRMWAASDVTFVAPIIVGDVVERFATIASVEAKRGKTGTLVFVEVDHVLGVGGECRIHERQTIVYRASDAPSRPAPPPRREAPRPDHEIERSIGPEVLFRYSALTFNSHRIHYDLPYATTVEGYPALVVHGPLQASLLLEFATDLRGGDKPRRFSFRGSAPLFAPTKIRLAADTTPDGLSLRVEDAAGSTTMTARADWS